MAAGDRLPGRPRPLPRRGRPDFLPGPPTGGRPARARQNASENAFFVLLARAGPRRGRGGEEEEEEGEEEGEAGRNVPAGRAGGEETKSALQPGRGAEAAPITPRCQA